MPFPDISPIALDLGFFQIRWYALAYLCGFLGGWFWALRLVKLYPKDSRPHGEDIENLVTWIILGVIFGGRLGYVLFYNLGYYAQNPIEILYLSEGGMSFHGGVIGVMTAIIGYCLKHKISLLKTADIITAVVPIGLGLGRIANFINAELYGRETDMPWGVIFPTGGDVARHPSQIYEAVLEGLVLLTLLNILIRIPVIRSRTGAIAGLFFMGYGLSRFVVEFFREPDAHIGFLIAHLSMGQLLSLPMIIFGGSLIVYVMKRHGR